MKFSIKKISAMLCASAIIMNMTACSGESGSAEEVTDTSYTEAENTEESVKTDIDDTEKNTDDTYKADDLSEDDMNRIEICGKTVSLPFSADELGEDFSVGGRGNKQLYYKGEPFASTSADRKTPELISEITLSLDWFDVKIAGLTFSQATTAEDIIAEWGEPDKSLETDEYSFMLYLVSDELRIKVTTIDGYSHMITVGERNIDDERFYASVRKNDFDELPDDLTMEQLCNMVSVDGYQLSFPCSTDDILSLSKDFSSEIIAEKDNMISSDLFYKDKCILRMTYDNDENIYFISIPNRKDNVHLSINGISLADNIAIEKHFVDITDTQVDRYGDIHKIYNDGTMLYELQYQRGGVIILQFGKKE